VSGQRGSTHAIEQYKVNVASILPLFEGISLVTFRPHNAVDRDGEKVVWVAKGKELVPSKRGQSSPFELNVPVAKAHPEQGDLAEDTTGLIFGPFRECSASSDPVWIESL
jgi:hypothetical protein